MQQGDLRSIWTGACVVSWMGHEIITPDDSLGPPIHFTELKIRPEKSKMTCLNSPEALSSLCSSILCALLHIAAFSSTELLMEALFLKM